MLTIKKIRSEEDEDEIFLSFLRSFIPMDACAKSGGTKPRKRQAVPPSTVLTVFTVVAMAAGKRDPQPPPFLLTPAYKYLVNDNSVQNTCQKPMTVNISYVMYSVSVLCTVYEASIAT
jgi:hypothetical protein